MTGWPVVSDSCEPRDLGLAAGLEVAYTVQQLAHPHGAGVVEAEIKTQPLGARDSHGAARVKARRFGRRRSVWLEQPELQVVLDMHNLDPRLPGDDD